MKRPRFFKLALGLLACALLAAVSLVQRQLNRERATLGLTRLAPLENAPPVLAFTTVALGGFRGLIANALWLRATDLQENDKFFEMVQLADWITKLQPHFTTVWIHQAWNMAYNISVKFPDPKARWQWVRRGIELLRDQGLKYNPDEPLIYRELAWFFQHKMGANLDDAHNYYKQVWAEQMNSLFGGGRPNFEALIHPKTDADKNRARILREKYKMDPAIMRQVDQTYGPLEWRLPETHAIYWAYVGLQHTENIPSKKKDLIQLRRVIFQSMQLAFQRGRMVVPKLKGGSFQFVLEPNVDIVAKVNQAYLQMMADDPAYASNIATGHKNFLKTAVYFLYTNSRLREAQEWFDYMKSKYPISVLDEAQLAYHNAHPDAPLPPKTLDQFAIEMIGSAVGETSHERITAIVEGLMRTSFLHRALGDDDQANGYAGFAWKVYERFQASIPKVSQTRVGLVPFETLRAQALREVLDPHEGLQPELADQLRTALNLPAGWPGTNAPPSAPPPAGASTNAAGVTLNSPASE